MDETFEAIAVGGGTAPPRAALPSAGVRSRVLVPRAAFEADVRGSYGSADAARRQADLDAPRCHLEVDGARCLTCPAVPPALLPLCTQAVLGLAVERLHHAAAGAPVLEPRPSSPLRVRLTREGTLVARKRLRVRGGDVCVLVHAGEGDDCVVIEYVGLQ